MTQNMPSQPPAPEFDGGEQPGGNIEAQIKEGVQAFMQSQDPAIAVEVVKMLAQEMGIAPEVDPYGDESQQAPQPMQPQGPSGAGGGQEMPMGRMGMKIFKKGGKIKYQRK